MTFGLFVLFLLPHGKQELVYKLYVRERMTEAGINKDGQHK